MENKYDYDKLPDNDKDAIKVLSAYTNRESYIKNLKDFILWVLLGYSFGIDASLVLNNIKEHSGNNLFYTSAFTSATLILAGLIKYAKDKKEIKELRELFFSMKTNDISYADFKKYLISYNNSNDDKRENDKLAVTKARKYKRYQKKDMKLQEAYNKINDKIDETDNPRDKHELVNERARIDDLKQDNLIGKYELLNDHESAERIRKTRNKCI